MKSWSDAQSNCNAIAPAGKIGDLASVPNEETNIFLSNITSDRLWIGGYLNSEGNWAWMDNSTWTFDAFAQGQSCNKYLDLEYSDSIQPESRIFKLRFLILGCHKF